MFNRRLLIVGVIAGDVESEGQLGVSGSELVGQEHGNVNRTRKYSELFDPRNLSRQCGRGQLRVLMLRKEYRDGQQYQQDYQLSTAGLLRKQPCHDQHQKNHSNWAKEGEI